MALTPTKQIPLGFVAPNFTLPDTVSGKTMSLEQLKADKATVVMFICNHCPYVKHVNEALVALANDYMPKGVSFVAISSNDAEAYPADGPEQMKTEAARLGYPFPYLYDETQEVAKAYTAECTPDFNIFDGNLRCVYRGQLDGSRPGSNVPVTGKDMRQALDAILAGKPVSTSQTPSVGCNIKWKG
ncbi:thioredoxin family protein [uncultured Microscilla sp.]|uniref:thioredoxin family protein n=1 Tax=uncultured Microscilla sp. TaxID=432653 RepID=UPI002610B64E|nr:thioredoxin family protein [uncultured Microscilla sp.]